MFKTCRYKHLLFYPQLLLLLFFASNIFSPTLCGAANHLYDVRYWSSPASTRIVLDIKSDTRYNTFYLKNPHRIVIDLKGFDSYLPKKSISVKDGIVKKIRISQKSRGIIRIVVDLEKKSSHKIFPLKKVDKKHPRIVVDILRADLENAVKVKRAKTRELKKKGAHIVIIDPGHGGDDPGAVSRRGSKEKDIVYGIAKKIARQLNRKKGIKAYLTRKGDYFIPLRKRIEIAKQYGADLFISIHADSSFSRKVNGSSVYCLSLKGASSNTAKIAARKENASDVIGGVPLDYRNNDLNTIIFDLVQTHTMNSSLKLAGIVLGEISKINRVHTNKPQQANFAVLRAPDIPAILVETDFLSNSSTEKKLRSQSFQNTFAKSITRATIKFLSASNGSLSAKKQSKPVSKYHTVKKGETLGSIAQKYNTTVTRLRKLNRMSRGSVLKAGKKLRIDSSKPAAKKQSKPVSKYHVVKKGETLGSIAQKYNTTVTRLRKLNRMSRGSVLKAGKKLRIL